MFTGKGARAYAIEARRIVAKWASLFEFPANVAEFSPVTLGWFRWMETRTLRFLQTANIFANLAEFGPREFFLLYADVCEIMQKMRC